MKLEDEWPMQRLETSQMERLMLLNWAPTGYIAFTMSEMTEGAN